MTTRVAYFSFNEFPSHYAHTVNIMKMCQALQENGWETTLFLCGSQEHCGSSDDELFEEYGIRQKFRLQWVDLSTNIWLARWKMFWISRRASREYRVSYTRNFICAFAALRAKRACIFEIHSPVFSRLGEVAMRWIVRQRPARLVAISEELATELCNKYGVRKQHVIVEHDAHDPVTNGASPSLPPELLFDLSTERVKAVYVGSFYAGRGLEMLSALAEIHADVLFIAVGAKRGEPVALSSAPSNLHFHNRIPHRAVPEVLSYADILLMPYAKRVTVEGIGDNSRFCSPLKLFEYLGSGKAIITSRLPAILEVLQDEKNALIADAEDIEGWSAALGRLKADEGLRDRLGRAAGATAQEYTWQKRAARIIERANVH
ncbi:MAG: glycosyltransferase [Actinobacteria bacterium]|nr:MAG: glycosyltransferase [Actinomycetota bacterium]